MENPSRLPTSPPAALLTEPRAATAPGARSIELHLRDLEQLFNTMDPSPFHAKDLDQNAEEFIVSWAKEYHPHEAIALVVHLENMPANGNPGGVVTDAVHNYFAYRARLNDLEFKSLMKQGRMSLFVGVSFLLLCLALIESFGGRQNGTMGNFVSEGLTIAGWVAMWRPMQIYLYDWWPLRRRSHLLNKLSTMPVEVRPRR